MAKKDNNDEIEDNENTNKDNSENFNEADDSFGLPHVEYEPLDRDEDPYGETTEEARLADDNDVYASDRDAYVPGSYSSTDSNSTGTKIFVFILILLLAGGGVWYFMYFKPKKQAEERARVEEQKRLDLQEQKEAQERAERERLALEQAQMEEEAALVAEAKPKTGSIETISSRTGRYYVVIASAIDEDLAMDHAKKLSRNGISATIIEPFGTSKFHRIAIDNRDTWVAAQNEANELKAEYGDGVWVIKY